MIIHRVIHHEIIVQMTRVDSKIKVWPTHQEMIDTTRSLTDSHLVMGRESMDPKILLIGVDTPRASHTLVEMIVRIMNPIQKGEISATINQGVSMRLAVTTRAIVAVICRSNQIKMILAGINMI